MRNKVIGGVIAFYRRATRFNELMRDDFIIRSAEAEDFEPLMKLYERSVQRNAQGFIQDIRFHGSLIEKAMHWRKTGGDLIAARKDGRVIGLGGLAPLNTSHVELCKLHVAPDQQGLGVGRALAERLISHAWTAPFSEVHLHVTASQTAAIMLYRSLGFTETQRAPFSVQVFGKEAVFDTIYMVLTANSARLGSTRHSASAVA